MTVHPIGSAGAALYITPEDLEKRGIDPETLTLEDALALTRAAFRRAGLALEGPVEIEAYPERSGVLVFARVRPRAQAWFSFDRLEGLAAAARALDRVPPEAALFWAEGRWWLALDGGGEGAAARLSEFGRAEEPPAGRGRPVWERDALEQVLTYYPV